MIQCNADGGCERWYHYTCQDMTEDMVARITTYACADCTFWGEAETTYKDLEGQDEDASERRSNEASEDQDQPVVGDKRKVAPESGSKAKEKKARVASKAVSSEIPVDCEDAGSNEHTVARANDRRHEDNDHEDKENDGNENNNHETGKANNGNEGPERFDHANARIILTRLAGPKIPPHLETANRLCVDPQFAILPGQSANANDSDSAGAQSNADSTFKERLYDIVQRHTAIGVQQGALLVVGGDDEDLQMIRENHIAIREHMLEHLSRLKDAQNGALESLRLHCSEPTQADQPIDLDELFDFDDTGMAGMRNKKIQ